MTSLLNERSGAQRPRVSSVPAYSSSAGQEAVELARMAGLYLDPWQEFVLAGALGERPDGKWTAFEVGLVVSRQNGKGSILEARELAGLFLLEERLIIHSAHQFDTSLEAFYRILALIEARDEFSRRVAKVSRSHGEEGIKLLSGQRLRFRTRTKGGGRGFTGDCLILDEAMDLPEAAHGALLPTLSARPNPQVWYTGSAVDQEVHEHGLVLARVRKRGLAGDDALAYFEWSPDATLETVDTADQDAWAQANPSLGRRISVEHVALEQRSMPARTFAVERLGVGDWPDPDALNGQAISLEDWLKLKDDTSEMVDPVCLAFDVRPDRSGAAIAAAGRRRDGQRHVEVIDRRAGTGWLPERLAEIAKRQQPAGIVYDKASPAAALEKQLEALGVKVRPIGAAEHAQACGRIFDLVDQQAMRHLGTQELSTAIQGAVKRPLGEAWAWSRKNSRVDISPLVACTLALWESEQARKSAYEEGELLIA